MNTMQSAGRNHIIQLPASVPVADKKEATSQRHYLDQNEINIIPNDLFLYFDCLNVLVKGLATIEQ